jgi:hypothetical protein
MLKEGRRRKKKLEEIVGDQTANQAAKPWFGGKKIKLKKNNNHQFLKSRVAGILSYSVTPLSSSLVCVSLRHVSSPLVVAPEEAWWSGYLEGL